MYRSFHWAVLLILALPVALVGCGQPQSIAQTPDVSPTSSPSPASSESPAAPTESNETAAVENQPAPAETPATHQSAVPAEAPKAQRPPADRGPSRPGDAEKITFDDLDLVMDADIVFREFMVSDRVRELEGKRISIVGYMHPPETQRGIKKFILLKNTQCKFGPGGQADHLADVNLRADNSTVFTPSPLKIEGTLKLAPFEGPDGNTWSIYRIEDAQIR